MRERVWVLGAALGLTLLAAGCYGRKQQQDILRGIDEYQQRAVAGAADYADTGLAQPAAQGPSTQPAARPSVEPATLAEYIRLALERNPDVAAAAERVRARAARIEQVTALSDPVLKMKILPEPVRTAEGDNYLVVGLSQKLPVPEKLSRAGRVALQEARMALAELEAVRLRVIADVKRAYYRLYVVDRTIENEQASADLLRGLIDAVRAQLVSGRRTQADVLRAQVELATIESRLIVLRRQRDSAAAALNRLMSRDPQAPVAATSRVEPATIELQLERLLAVAVHENPQLERLAERVERQREALALAHLAWWPDLTLGLEWIQVDPRGAFEPPPNPQTGMRPPTPQMSESGSDNWAITLSVNLPIWTQRIRAGIREARRRLAAAQHELQAARDRVEFAVEDAYLRVREQQELVAIFESTIIPQAQQTYEVSQAAYTAGRTDFLTVIDNWYKWLVYNIQYHRAVGELLRSLADLEESLGVSLMESERDDGTP